ncbi:MAG: type II toxin-antitoxin system PemK/MazF family toxin [Rhodocyclaceae bacterium]|nr:type II toxin-antitoxin system PemK/MazF family toxin [Rhodocyclaceae bacterium]
MAWAPNRGEIVHPQFDPASRQEMKGPHYALVVSARSFNQLGLAFVCPISQGAAAAARSFGTVVTLSGSGTDTQGAIDCHQLKSLDWRQRRAVPREAVPQGVLDEAMARIEAILTD